MHILTCYMHQVCLSLIHASIQANRLLITAQPIIADDEQKRVLIAGVVEGTNVITGHKCNKVTSVITFGHKCNKGHKCNNI